MAGAGTIFLAPFFFFPLGPFIVVVALTGGFELPAALRLARTAPTGGTVVAFALAAITGWWLLANEGDGPPGIPTRVIGPAILLMIVVGAILAVFAPRPPEGRTDS